MTQLEVSAGAPSADAELTRRAIEGEHDAFEELYRRHAPAAWRVAQAVAGNQDDAADAVSDAFTRVLSALRSGRYDVEAPFRPYLLTATRNAAIDVLRRRTRAGDVVELRERTGSDGAADELVDRLDRGLVATAFRSLPERWRTVLWLTEVEGVPPREAAAVLGLSANGTAQLAVRARAALRARYLQAHLGRVDDDACRRTIELLGAYVAGGLAPRDIARVDQHLAGCDGCRARVHHLEDVGSGMALGVVPLPLALAGTAFSRWRDGISASAGSLPAKSLTHALGSWAAVVFAVGVWSLLAPGGGDGEASPDPRPRMSSPQLEVAAADAPLGSPGAAASTPRRRPPPPDVPRDDAKPPAGEVPPVAPPPEERPAPDGSTPVPPTDRGGVVEVSLGAAVEGDGVQASVGVGGGCTGLDCGDPPEGTGVSVATGGSAAPPVDVHLP